MITIIIIIIISSNKVSDAPLLTQDGAWDAFRFQNKSLQV